jgi:hypothetical protein
MLLADLPFQTRVILSRRRIGVPGKRFVLAGVGRIHAMFRLQEAWKVSLGYWSPFLCNATKYRGRKMNGRRLQIQPGMDSSPSAQNDLVRAIKIL